MNEPKVVAVILAAGGSSRMGRPKVLLELDGEPMVRRVARRAAEAGCGEVIVVAGDEVEAIARALSDSNVQVVENPQWAEGIGSSIASGVRAADAAGAGAVMILLADQPDVSLHHLGELIAAFRRGADPAATRYGESGGVPAIFGASYFPRLSALTGDHGARSLLAGAALVGTEAPVDLDTPADWESRTRR